jgi:nitroreductase
VDNNIVIKINKSLFLACSCAIFFYSSLANTILVSVLDFFEVIKNRRSIRKYQDKAVEQEKILRILDAGRLASSAMNRQPYEFFIITKKDILVKLNSACNQDWSAPVMLAVVCLPERAWVREDGEEFWKADAAIALNQILLAAHAEDLGGCWVSAFHEDEVKQILELNSKYRVAYLATLGYPDEYKGPITNRKTLESLVRFV